MLLKAGCSFSSPRPFAAGNGLVSGRARPVRRPVGCRATTEVPEEIISMADALKLDNLMNRFKMADTDGNGFIDRNELRQLLESTEGGDAVMFTEHWLPEDELDRVIEQYDKDKNGVIDFEEFKQIVIDGLLLDGQLSEYEAAFNAVDSSGNGTIGAMELAELFRSLGNSMSYEGLVDVMQKYDKDESGQIEFKEFLLMFRDQLLELKAVQQYMSNQAADRVVSQALLDTPEGGLALIFSEDEFNEISAQCQSKGKLLVLFNALTWCRPCKGMQRPSQKMAEAYKGQTTWVKMFGNANEKTKNMFKNKFKIRSTPCFIVFHNGEIVYTQTGTNKEKLETGIRTALKEAGISVPKDCVYATEEAVPATAAP